MADTQSRWLRRRRLLRICFKMAATPFCALTSFWRQCAGWHLKGRQFALVASTRNYLEIYILYISVCISVSVSVSPMYACIFLPKVTTFLAKKGGDARRKFSLEIQAIAFEKFQFLTVSVCVRVVRQILFILHAPDQKQKLETEN